MRNTILILGAFLALLILAKQYPCFNGQKEVAMKEYVFEYFDAPRDDMSDLIEGNKTCSICGATGPCLSLSSAECEQYANDETDDKLGCFGCLKEGKFVFDKDTEIGWLRDNGLETYNAHQIAMAKGFSQQTMTKLLRTPEYSSWQEAIWLIHCNDFMVYKGTWEPEDFNKNSPDGDGRALFLKMTDEDMNHVWDDSIPDGESVLKEWRITYYVFKCHHCGKLRGNWDCD